MAKWTEVENTGIMFLQNNFIPDCIICGEDMKPIIAKPVRFDLHGLTMIEENQKSRAIDVEFRCPKEGYWEQFGVAVTKEHYEKVMNLIGIIKKGKRDVDWKDVEEN